MIQLFFYLKNDNGDYALEWHRESAFQPNGMYVIRIAGVDYQLAHSVYEPGIEEDVPGYGPEKLHLYLEVA